MIPNTPLPAVVPAGQMADLAQPTLAFDGGLQLRPWQASDAETLVAAGQDLAIRQWNRLVVPDAEQARQRIERMHRRWKAEEAAIWAIAEPGAAPIGLLGWGDIDLEEGTAEIVYWLLPAARGAGVALEATRRATDWALNELGLHRLRLCHSTANPASCRVAEKAGYTLEGTMRSALLHADGWHDQHLHALVRGDT